MGVRRGGVAAGAALQLLLQVVVPVLLVIMQLTSAVEAFGPSSWNAAHATYYGGADASGTQGACLVAVNCSLPSKC